MAQSGYRVTEFRRPLLGVKRTLVGGAPMLTQSGHGCGPAWVRRTAQISIQKCDSLLIPDLVLGAGEAMRRREFTRLFSSAVVAWPLAARAPAVSGASDWVSPQHNGCGFNKV